MFSTINFFFVKLHRSHFVRVLTFHCSPADGTVNGYAVIQVIKLEWPLIGILRKNNHLCIFLIYGHSPVLFTAYLLLSTEVSSVDFYHHLRASKVAQWVKNLPAKQETHKTHVQSLGLGNPLEGEMATLSSILARRIPWREEPGGL